MHISSLLAYLDAHYLFTRCAFTRHRRQALMAPRVSHHLRADGQMARGPCATGYKGGCCCNGDMTHVLGSPHKLALAIFRFPLSPFWRLKFECC